MSDDLKEKLLIETIVFYRMEFDKFSQRSTNCYSEKDLDGFNSNKEIASGYKDLIEQAEASLGDIYEQEIRENNLNKD